MNAFILSTIAFAGLIFGFAIGVAFTLWQEYMGGK